MKQAKKISTAKQLRIIDRGDWFVLRIPNGLLSDGDRDRFMQYKRDLPTSDHRYSYSLNAWVIKSDWLDIIVEMLTGMLGRPINVE